MYLIYYMYIRHIHIYLHVIKRVLTCDKIQIYTLSIYTYMDIHRCIYVYVYQEGTLSGSKMVNVLWIEESILWNQSFAPSVPKGKKKSAVYIEWTIFFLHHLAQKMNTFKQMSWKTAFRVEAASTVLWYWHAAPQYSTVHLSEPQINHSTPPVENSR